jgi:putative zinc finger/helix-turn-helix YgiT family protein
MTMKPFPWKCEECGERDVYPDLLGEYTASMDHDGRTYQVHVTNLDVVKCRKCGHVALHNPALRRLSDELRAVVGLLRPDEIRARREALGLTQKEMANYIQVAEGTLSRWETGAQIQQRVMDKLLRGFFEVEEFRRFLGVPSRGYATQIVATVMTVTSVVQSGPKKTAPTAWTYVPARYTSKVVNEVEPETGPPRTTWGLVG